MRLGLIGKKCGMSRVFKETGESVPVTLIHVDSNRIAQIKTQQNDGYDAVQVAVGENKPSRVKQPLKGHYKKAGIKPAKLLHEHRVDDVSGFEVGQEISINDVLDSGVSVDVTGYSKGRGFSGGIRRHNFGTQDKTHGGRAYRSPGAIGQCQSPGRVFKGKKMAGQYGSEQTTIQSLEVVDIDTDNQLLAIKGSVPGSKGQMVVVKPAIKTGVTQNES